MNENIISTQFIYYKVMELKVRPREFSVRASVGADFGHFSFSDL